MPCVHIASHTRAREPAGTTGLRLAARGQGGHPGPGSDVGVAPFPQPWLSETIPSLPASRRGLPHKSGKRRPTETEKKNRQREENRFPSFLKQNRKWHIGKLANLHRLACSFHLLPGLNKAQISTILMPNIRSQAQETRQDRGRKQMNALQALSAGQALAKITRHPQGGSVRLRPYRGGERPSGAATSPRGPAESTRPPGCIPTRSSS